MTPRIPPRVIAEKVAEVLGFSLLDMISARRSAELVEARRAAWILIKEFRPDSSTIAMGLLFNRDHSTIVVGLQDARRRLKDDALFRAAVEDLRETLMKWPVAARAA